MELFTKPGTPGVTITTGAPKPSEGAGWGGTVITVFGGLLLLYLGYVFFNYIQTWNGQPGLKNPFDFGASSKGSGDKTPAPVDGKTRTVIPAGEVPSTGGADWGLQYWMYISDWNYKFGSDKDVVKRIAPNNPAMTAPRIFLSPSDNTLNVRISIFPTDAQAGAANPSSSSSTGDSFTCSVENVPLQSWFAVSVTCFQRNLDIYINGRLVKSCVLPGIPKPTVGDIILNDNGGFSGSVCNLNWYNTMLAPEDSKAFHAKGTQCAPPATAGVTPVDEDSVFVTLFGYTFRFSKIAKDGKELSSYTL
jgi:hypothetical protein